MCIVFENVCYIVVWFHSIYTMRRILLFIHLSPIIHLIHKHLSTIYLYPQDISCPEAVKVDDIDSAAVTTAFEAAKAAFGAAEAGSRASAEAQIDMEVNKSMAAAAGVIIA